MKFLIRQTYTTTSLVVMIPAAIWAVSWYGASDMIHVISRFPYVYLFICQMLVVPRYVAAAWLSVWFAHRYKQFDITAAIIGFTAAGVVLDIWLTYQFARAIGEPPAGNHALLLPLGALIYGLVFMMAAALAGGFGWAYVQHRMRPPAKRKR